MYVLRQNFLISYGGIIILCLNLSLILFVYWGRGYHRYSVVPLVVPVSVEDACLKDSKYYWDPYLTGDLNLIADRGTLYYHTIKGFTKFPDDPCLYLKQKHSLKLRLGDIKQCAYGELDSVIQTKKAEKQTDKFIVTFSFTDSAKYASLVYILDRMDPNGVLIYSWRDLTAEEHDLLREKQKLNSFLFFKNLFERSE